MDSKIKFYTSWFCPYAQRAWITLEHHQLDYERIEAYDGTQKIPRLLELNPKGQVPTMEFSKSMVDELTQVETRHMKEINGVLALTESMNCIKILNSMARKGATPDLITEASLLTAADKFDQNICGKFMKILAAPTEADRRDAYVSFATSIAEYTEMIKEGGFYGSNDLTIVDVTTVPLLLRIFVLDNYRPEYKLGDYMSEACLQKFSSYMERVKELPAVKHTLWKGEEGMIQQTKKFVAN